MKLNAEKYHVIKFGKHAKKLDWDYKLESNSLQVPVKEKGFVATVKNRLSSADYTNKKVRNMQSF